MRLSAALLFCAAGLLAAAAGLADAADRPNFSGTWELDQSRSHSIPQSMTQTMTVVHEGDRVTVESKVGTPQGERVIKDVYTLDGKESEFTAQAPPNAPAGAPPPKGKRTARWLPNDAGFVVEEEVVVDGPQGNKETVTFVRKWRRWADGTISVEIMQETPRGAFNSKRVFVRK